MPRQSTTPSVRVPRRTRKVSHTQKLAFISQYKRVSDPTNKRSVDTQWRRLKQFPLYLQKKANKEQRAELKKRGFFTTDKGVIVDGPRDSRRKQIKGTRFKILKDGVIKYSVKSRDDYVVGMTKAQKKAFALDPAKVSKQIEKEWRAKLKARGVKIRDFQLRLQWGAYQATKDFHPGYFTKRYAHIPARDRARVNDRLTGFHIVVHRRK